MMQSLEMDTVNRVWGRHLAGQSMQTRYLKSDGIGRSGAVSS